MTLLRILESRDVLVRLTEFQRLQLNFGGVIWLRSAGYSWDRKVYNDSWLLGICDLSNYQSWSRRKFGELQTVASRRLIDQL